MNSGNAALPPVILLPLLFLFLWACVSFLSKLFTVASHARFESTNEPTREPTERMEQEQPRRELPPADTDNIVTVYNPPRFFAKPIPAEMNLPSCSECGGKIGKVYNGRPCTCVDVDVIEAKSADQANMESHVYEAQRRKQGYTETTDSNGVTSMRGRNLPPIE